MPLADVARTRLLLRLGGLPPGIDRAARQQIERIRPRFWAVYQARYGEIRPSSTPDLVAWELPVAAACLDEGIVEQAQALLAFVAAHLRV